MISPSFKKGFTLIELVVTVGVFVLLSTSLLNNYRNTTKSLSLNSLANLIGSDIRRTQSYGIASLNYSNTEDYYYGISFNKAYPDSYMIYKSLYTVTAGGVVSITGNSLNEDFNSPTCTGIECLERMIIKSGSSITQLCVNTKKTGTCTVTNALHIAFKRPDPEATIRNGGGVICSDAEVIITSADGTLTKTIVIWSTGLITIE